MGTVVRAQAVFRGNVQGVGFRYTTRHLASAFRVAGYVENEPDGSVELVAEGTREQVAGLIDSVREQMADYIRTCDIEWGAARGELDGFRVRFGW